jgi:hypothetical protein
MKYQAPLRSVVVETSPFKGLIPDAICENLTVVVCTRPVRLYLSPAQHLGPSPQINC